MPIYGPEPWRELRGVTFTHWDRWLLRVAVLEDGGLDSLVTRFEADRRAHRASFRRDAAEAKLAQIADLSVRLKSLGMTPAEVLGEEDAADKKVLRRAQDKLFNQPLGRVTPAMVDTPRKRLQERAMRGQWPRFPISPATFERESMSYVEEERFHEWRQTMRLSRRLDRLLEKRDRALKGGAERLAFFRSVLTVIVEAMERVDDSHGSMAQTFADAWKTYVAIEWKKTGIEPMVYFRDMIEFATWEDYGLVDDLGKFFGGLAADDAAIVEHIFGEVIPELHGGGFEYEEEKARTCRVDFLIAHGLHDRFVEAAADLGSRAWGPIVAMGEAAMRAGDRALALAVFAAADQPGMQRDYLRKECQRITGAAPPAVQLRLVK